MIGNPPNTLPDAIVPDDLSLEVAQLRQALESERAARIAAEQDSQAKSDLLATVSHEIRTPMGAIISMADLMLTTSLNDTQRNYASTLRQSGRGLLAILNDILDYSKLSAGRFELENIHFDFSDLMQSATDAVAARADAKGLQATVETCEGCPTHFIGDPVRLRQVLNNLIDNALKFTEVGSVNIRASYTAEGPDASLRFEIRDTGIGLAEMQRARLFEPYTQADSATAIQYGGTGLGLSIAKRLAELMGGELGCESVEGQGSIFWFTAKMKQVAGDVAPAPARALVQPADMAPLSGHVLIVEDNEVNQMLIEAYLDNFGLTYETAPNGRMAVEAVAAKPFDLVLMDIMMPEMDGVEATRQIRALPGPAAKTIVVALTANAMKGDRETYLASGMDGYVSKPVGAADLFAALAVHLAIPQQAQPAIA